MTTLEQSGRFSVEQVKDLTRALESSQTTQWVTNEQLRASLAEIRAEIADFKAEVKTEIAQVRTEIAVAVNKIVLWVVGIDLAFSPASLAYSLKRCTGINGNDARTPLHSSAPAFRIFNHRRHCASGRRGARDGQGALALTDLGNVFGWVKFYQYALRQGVKPIAGCDVWITNPGERDQPS